MLVTLSGAHSSIGRPATGDGSLGRSSNWIEMARLLLIQSDHSLRRSTATALSEAGHSVISASSAVEGLALERLETFQVVLVDLGLSDMNGLAVLDRMRERGSRSRVLLMVEGRQPLVLQQSVLQRLGCRALWKPFSLPALLDALQECLEKEPAL